MRMPRRTFVLAASAMAAPAAAQTGGAPNDPALQAALQRFTLLPGEKSLLVEAESPGGPWRLAFQPDLPLFVGSAFKTFVLAAWLQEVEAGRRRLEEQVTIDDGIRSLVSPVLEHLTGTTQARAVLEAMIAHSDNTATDAAMRILGAGRVREVVQAAGLRATRIPASTRRMFSVLAGAPPGTDLGWDGIRQAMEHPVGPLRPPVNEYESSVSTASDLVAWYRRALAGEFFRKPETLAEFRHIQSMADAIPLVVPPGIAAYAKGGSIFWQDSNAVAVAGQIVVHGRPASFCFSFNWRGEESGVPQRLEAFRAATAGVLARTADILS
jgi:beta-lactamase class A